MAWLQIGLLGGGGFPNFLPKLHMASSKSNKIIDGVIWLLNCDLLQFFKVYIFFTIILFIFIFPGYFLSDFE